MSQAPMKENKMGSMPVLPLIFNMALPMMASMLVLALYNVVDSIFVSMISENAFTAVSLAFPLQNLIIAFGAGTGVGINALVSRALGQRAQGQAQSVAMNGLFLSLLNAIVFALVGIFATHTFFASQTEVAEIITYGTQYGSIVCMLSFGCFFSITFERLLQSTGGTMYCMYTQGLGAIINIVMDPIFIFGLFGFPKMGVAGAALATVLGQICSMFLAFYFCLRKNPELPLYFKGFRPDKAVIGAIYKIGAPSIVMQAIGSVMTYGMNLILIGFSTTAAGVFGAYFKLMSFIFMPVFGLSNSLVPIVAYNYGAKNRQRIVDAFRYGFAISFVILGTGMLAFMFAPQVLLGFFNPTEEFLEIGNVALRIISISFLPASFGIAAAAVFQGLGCAMYSMIASFVRQLVGLLPVAYLLSLTGNLALVWWAFPIADILALVITVFFLHRAFHHVLSKEAMA